MNYCKLFLALGLSFFLGSKGSAQICDKNQLPLNLQNGLVAFYPFCGNANDVSGNGNDGTVIGATLASDRFQGTNQAYNFNGVDQYINLNSTNGLSSTAGLSLSAWINWAGPNGVSDGQVIYLIAPNPSGSISINNNGDLSVNVSNCNCSTDTAITSRIEQGKWYHIVLSYDYGTGVLKMYLNGSLISSTQRVSNNYYTTNNPQDRIGNYHFNSFYYNGLVDEVGLWNRSLEDAEVQSLYTGVDCSAFQINPLSDTTRVCGDSTELDAGTGYKTYSWSTGETTQKIVAKSSGIYTVRVTNDAGCSAMDSSLVSIVKAKILQRDTTICKGASITLAVDSSGFSPSSSWTSNLQTGLVAFYPFNGNANDESGNGNDGVVNGPVLTSDRFGRFNTAYNFDGISSKIKLNNLAVSSPYLTTSAWVKVQDYNYNIGNRLQTLFYFGRENGGSNPFTNSISTYIDGVNYTPSKLITNLNYNYGQTNTISGNTSWMNVITIYDGINHTLKLYLDGQLVNTSSVTPNYIELAASDNNYIGASYSSGLGGIGNYFKGQIDDVAIWNRALSSTEIAQLITIDNHQTSSWSTGATSNLIIVSPTQTTKYNVTVSDGITSYQDSITVKVQDITGFNPLTDTVSLCGDSTELDAGAGYKTYTWSNGATTQKITAKSSGKYSVTVTNDAGCSAVDSSLVSIVKAHIIQRDTTICKGASITLALDSTQFSAISSLPSNLRNGLVAYYPFNGNVNDESGNGLNGQLQGNYNFEFGRFGKSLKLTGDNNTSPTNVYGEPLYINGGYLKFPDFSKRISNAISISFWFKMVDNIPKEYPIFFGKDDYGQNRFLIDLFNGFYLGDNFPMASISSSNVNISNNWKMFTMTYTPGEFCAYVNGILIGTSATIVNSIPLNNGALNWHNWANGQSARGTALYDDVIFWDKKLSPTDVSNLFQSQNTATWSTGDTTSSITVSPTETTTYTVIVSDGITSCQDSVTVTVQDIAGFNPLSDTLSVCGDSTELDAGAGYKSYLWSNGDTTQKTTIKSSGKYSVTVTNDAGCSAMDSSLVSIVKAKIIQRDTTICKGASIALAVNSFSNGANSLPSSLQSSLAAYYPFNGNANDESGNVNNGVVNGATLANSATGKSNGAYYFNGINNNIDLPNPFFGGGQQNVFTVSARVNFESIDNDPNIWGKSFFWGEVNFQVNRSGTIYFWWANSISGNKYSGIYSDENIISAGKWYDIVVRFENSVGSIFVNGVPIKTNLGWNAQGGGLLSTTQIDQYCNFAQDANSSKFGGRINSGSLIGLLKGYLDEFIFFNRALTDSEIFQISNTLNKNQWSTGDTTSSITVSPTQTTTYTVTATDGIGSCTDQVTITVATVDTTITALDATSVCSNTPSVRLQAGSGSQYQWLKNGTAITNATQQLYTATSSGSYRVVVTNNLGCSDTSRTIEVTANPQPVAGFSINDATQCITGNSFGFTNTTTLGSGTFQSLWSFADASTASSIDALHSYAAAGTYNTKLVVTSDQGCKDSTTKIVTVYALPVVSVNNASICSGTSTTLTASGADSYTWSPSTGLSASTGSSVVASPTSTTTYTITGTSTLTGCSNTATSVVTVTSNATATILIAANNIGSVSPTTSVTFTSAITNGGDAPVYQWKKNGVNVGTNSSGYTNSSWVNGDVVSCVLTSNQTCMVSNTVTSNAITVSVSNASLYCSSNGVSTKEYIQKFVLNNISNTSGNNGGYGNFLSQTMNAEKGKTYSLSITPGWSGTARSEGYAMWIDYNSDGDFADAGELVFSKAKTTSTPITGSITIPATAVSGTSRLRVSMKYSAIPSSCEVNLPGEVEDYSISITAPVLDTQAPTAPTTLAASGITTSALTLTWNASTDNVGVTGYNVYRNGVLWGTTTTTSANITGLQPSTTYSFYVTARDAANNISSSSNTVQATTLGITYCSSTGVSTKEYIQRFQVGSINNSSGNNGGYGNYTNLSTNMALSGNQTVTIVPGWSSGARSETYRVWIDYNRDGDFADAGEQVASIAKTTASSVSASFTVPSTASAGVTRMRVSMKYSTSSSYCETGLSGEVEDYNVNITSSVTAMDVNLETTGSATRSVNTNLYARMYPNPVTSNGLVYIQTNASKILAVRVYNLQGQSMQAVYRNQILDLSGITKGSYFVEIITPEKVWVEKVIKR